MKESWTSGWLSQVVCLFMSLVTVLFGQPGDAGPYLVGSILIGVMRVHHKERMDAGK